MFEFAVGFAILVAVIIVLSICNFFSETYQELKEKEQYDLEQKKKQDALNLEAQRQKAEQELEAQRKKDELELELRRQAGLEPIYQEQMRKIKQYKVIIACLSAFIVLMLGYLIVPKNDSTRETIYGVSSKVDEMNTPIQDASLSSQEDQNLPKRFTPLLTNERLAEIKLVQTQPSNESREIVEPVIENPFEGNTSNTKTMKSDQISVYEARSHIGDNMTVCGEVSQISQTSKATYMNFGGQYPKHKFSAVIWSNNIMPASEGNNICITGLIESYKGTPQIVISSIENQISHH